MPDSPEYVPSMPISKPKRTKRVREVVTIDHSSTTKPHKTVNDFSTNCGIVTTQATTSKASSKVNSVKGQSSKVVVLLDNNELDQSSSSQTSEMSNHQRVVLTVDGSCDGLIPQGPECTTLPLDVSLRVTIPNNECHEEVPSPLVSSAESPAENLDNSMDINLPQTSEIMQNNEEQNEEIKTLDEENFSPKKDISDVKDFVEYVNSDKSQQENGNLDLDNKDDLPQSSEQIKEKSPEIIKNQVAVKHFKQNQKLCKSEEKTRFRSFTESSDSTSNNCGDTLQLTMSPGEINSLLDLE
jgi:hypothetical protein